MNPDGTLSTFPFQRGREWFYAHKGEEHGPFRSRGDAERALGMDLYYRRAAKRAERRSGRVLETGE